MSSDAIRDSVANERLRRSLLRAGLDISGLAETAQVSTKTVERWLREEAVPYPGTRYRVAVILQEDESYLWPEAVDKGFLAGAELLATYPRRSDVPRHLWTELLRQTTRNVDYLAFAGPLLAEKHPNWIPLLSSRAEAGARVRLLLGDPHGHHLASRDSDEIGGGVAGRVAAVLSYYRPLAGRIAIRMHDTPLYNSIYRFDDNMIVNTHVYGILAAYTPTMHLRWLDGAYFDTYLESIQRVWASARPLDDEDP